MCVAAWHVACGMWHVACGLCACAHCASPEPRGSWCELLAASWARGEGSGRARASWELQSRIRISSASRSPGLPVAVASCQLPAMLCCCILPLYRFAACTWHICLLPAPCASPLPTPTPLHPGGAALRLPRLSCNGVGSARCKLPAAWVLPLLPPPPPSFPPPPSRRRHHHRHHNTPVPQVNL
jgi:hypothetical protein